MGFGGMGGLSGEHNRSMPGHTERKQSHFVLELKLKVMRFINRFHIEYQQCVFWTYLGGDICIPWNWHHITVILLPYWDEWRSQASSVANGRSSGVADNVPTELLHSWNLFVSSME